MPHGGLIGVLSIYLVPFVVIGACCLFKTNVVNADLKGKSMMRVVGIGSLDGPCLVAKRSNQANRG